MAPPLDDLPVTRTEFAVFVSGVASMGLEILAGRMIAPQFGSSIYTWGSIIGVFLAALSYGYHRGGKRAAARATRGRMARLFLLTAAYVAGLIVAGDVLLRATARLPLPGRFASLPAVVVLFGLPTYALGYVSPYAAELSAQESLGAASGRVYTLGTVGSIVGAFGTTFVLIPALGIDRIALLLGLLALLAAVVLVGPDADRDQAAAGGAVVLLLVFAVAVGSGAAGVTVEGRVVHETETPYQHLEVIDRGSVRTLYLDGQRHSAMDLDDPDRHVFAYTRYFHLPLLMTDDVDRVLFVGGGGFTGPKRFVEDYDVTVDVAEIDPAVVDAAERYFGVEASDRLRIHTVDGRRYLRETNRTYDLIVLDAYRKDKVPFQLTTLEFMRLASDRLADDGVLFANVVSAPSGPASAFYRAEYRTMNRVFPQVYGFPTVGGTVVQNVVVIATKREAALTEAQLLARNERRSIGVDLADEIRRARPAPPTDDVPVLRDGHAPVDSLLDPMAGRRYVVRETNGTATPRPPDPAAAAVVRATRADRATPEAGRRRAA